MKKSIALLLEICLGYSLKVITLLFLAEQCSRCCEIKMLECWNAITTIRSSLYKTCNKSAKFLQNCSS